MKEILHSMKVFVSSSNSDLEYEQISASDRHCLCVRLAMSGIECPHSDDALLVVPFNVMLGHVLILFYIHH